MCVKRLHCKWTDKKLTLIILLVATLALFLAACALLEPPAPQRSFALKELLIDQETVSPAWEAFKPFCPCKDDMCTTECVAIQFGIYDREPPIRASQDIYRYRSMGIAQRTFEQVYLPRFEFLNSNGEWIYQSPIADQSHFGCYDSKGHTEPVCQWAGRYEEYIVVFRAHMLSGEMSLEGMEQVVRAIDARMAQYLDKPYQSTPTGR